MILSHTHRFIFLANGRTGTTAIEQALAPYQEGAEFEVMPRDLAVGKHVPPQVLRAMLGQGIWDGYFKFVFVRNPWDWFVSQFHYNATMVAGLNKLLAAKGPDDVLSAMDIQILYGWLKNYRGIWSRDSLFQHTYTHDEDGTCLVDFIGRFESLDRDVQTIFGRLGLAGPTLEAVNVSPDRRPYRHYYDAAGRDLIARLYAEDIDRFGYRFDPA